MTPFKNNFKGKKITVMGLGVLGRGINVVKFLANKGALLTVTDLKSPELLSSALEELKEYEDITYVLGEHRFKDFEDKDIVIKAAGVPLDSPYIAHARENNVPVKMDASLFAELVDPRVTLIGVTGTKGKTTVTHMIHHLLTIAGKKSYLGGNIRGQATLPLLDEVRAGDYVVLELDSWQLQGFGEANVSPHISVFTNFMPDHLNYYKGNMETYFNDKANIFRYQKKDDYLVLSASAFKAVKEYYKEKIKSKVAVAKSVFIPRDWKLKVSGEHNRENASLVLQVGEILGISFETIRESLESFPGVEGRLEFVREIDGVKYYNDTTATTPDALKASVLALSYEPIVLIAGGVDKGLEYQEVAEVINKNVQQAFLLPGGATEKLKEFLEVPYEEVSSMQEAVLESREVAGKGSVLMSPGAASFGLFRNEYDRGDQFLEAVNSL